MTLFPSEERYCGMLRSREERPIVLSWFASEMRAPGRPKSGPDDGLWSGLCTTRPREKALEMKADSMCSAQSSMLLISLFRRFTTVSKDATHPSGQDRLGPSSSFIQSNIEAIVWAVLLEVRTVNSFGAILGRSS